MKYVLPVLLLSLLSACSHVKVQVPQASVMPSELLKKDAWELGLRSQASRLHTASEDASARPPTFDNEDTASALFTGDLFYAPLDRLQFGAGVSSNVGIYGGIAYQFLGTPWAERKIGWSAALRLDVYSGATSKSGDQNGEFGPGGYNWKADLSVLSTGGGLSVGYRFHESFMTFLGVSQLSHKTKTTIKQDASDNGLDPGGTYSQSPSGSSTAVGLGFMIGSQRVRFISVLQWHEYELADAKSSEGSVNLSFVFGGL